MAVTKDMAVTKATYSAWEKATIAAFYTAEQKRTPLVPADGKPAVLSKEKVILVVDALSQDGEAISDTVQAASKKPGMLRASGIKDKLPEHRHVQLWHAGKQAADKVRFGLADDDGGLFKHPAFDAGGLTNLKQKLGQPLEFVGEAVLWGEAGLGESADIALVLLAKWRELAGKPKLHDEAALKADLDRFLQSVSEAVGACVLRFVQLPAEHRVVVTPADVRKATGAYYVRVLGGGDADEHARASDGKGLLCGVTDTFVTPNLNERNLHTEYLTYPVPRRRRSKRGGGGRGGGGGCCGCSWWMMVAVLVAVVAVVSHKPTRGYLSQQYGDQVRGRRTTLAIAATITAPCGRGACHPPARG
tara:strand:- start:251 stop:1330 length:1080 start_codon:yes stop_codon:yes gene_type:complete